jgi:hypothetical protein
LSIAHRAGTACREKIVAIYLALAIMKASLYRRDGYGIQ